MSTQKLLTIDDVSGILNIKKSTLYAWVHYRKIPYVKIGRNLGFQQEEIENFIKVNSYPPAN